MTTKKITRTIELTVERNERSFFRRREAAASRCAICEGWEFFMTPESAADRFAIRQSDIFRLIENDAIGHQQPPGQTVSVCPMCLETLFLEDVI
jgi:hypothetical protein